MAPKSLLAPARLAGRPVLRSQSDARLVDLVRAGSEPAFEAIVARYRGPLLRYCRRIVPEPRAEDVVQQAFVSALGAMQRDDAHIDLRPWLYRIVHNAALNALRDRSLHNAPLDERMDGVEPPERALERRQGLRELIAAVKALPERQRDAIVLRELEGRSYEEIAGELGVSGGAVRQLLNRARTTLRAGVTAVTPLPLLLRLGAGEGEPTAARVGELVGLGGASALTTKVVASALVTGAVVGGIATVPDRDGKQRAKSHEPDRAVSEPQHRVSQQEAGPAPAPRRDGAASAADSEERRGDGDDNSGPGSGERSDGGDSSGPGPSGDGGGEDHSGPGPGDGTTTTTTETDNSGPGGGDGSGSSGPSDSSGPGPGTDTTMTTTEDNSGPH